MVSEESRKERIDRELIELLNELRVVLPGVQVLFALLLTVPFAQGFTRVTAFQRDVYLATLLAAAVSTGLLMAPAAQHRILFRARSKERLLHRSNAYAVSGVVALAVSITLAVLLVTSVVYSSATARIAVTGLGLLLAYAWVVQPTLHRRRENGPDPDESPAAEADSGRPDGAAADEPAADARRPEAAAHR